MLLEALSVDVVASLSAVSLTDQECARWMCNSIGPDLPLGSVQELYFENSCFEVGHLANMVAACPKLERLQFWAGVQAMAIMEDFRLEDMWEILRTRAGTLKRVSFDFNENHDVVERVLVDEQTGEIIQMENAWATPQVVKGQVILSEDEEHVRAKFAEIGARCDNYIPLCHFGWPGY